MYRMCHMYKNYKNKNTYIKWLQYNPEWMWNVFIHSACPSLRLMLVLCLCGGVEVIQDTLHVIKRGPVLGFVPPAGHHDIIILSGTVVRLRHPVATLHRGHHLTFGHTWGQHRQICTTGYMKESMHTVVEVKIILVAVIKLNKMMVAVAVVVAQYRSHVIINNDICITHGIFASNTLFTGSDEVKMTSRGQCNASQHRVQVY